MKSQSAYELALKEIGTVEWANGANPKVMAYFKDAGHPEVSDDSTAWCAAFVGAMLKRSGLKPTGSLAARSYLKWGEPVDVKDAKPGDIVVFSRGNSSWQGHVAFFEKENASTITILGGNQSNKVSRTTYTKASLLSIRRLPVQASAPVAQETGLGALIARFFSALVSSLKQKGKT